MIPPLTTIQQPSVEMGIAAAEAILGRLAGEETAPPTFEGKLVMRESTGWRT